MSAELDPKTEIDLLEPLLEISEKQNLLFLLSSKLSEMKLSSILRFYRLASIVLSSLLFILFPSNYPLYSQLSLLLLIATFSILMVALYEQYWKNIKILLALILIELFSISLLLAFTGGFNGPFLWYAVNPFIVATAFFPFVLAWLLLALLLTGTYIWMITLSADILNANQIFNNNFYPALNLIVIVLIMHLFARMHMTMSEQSLEKRSQQQELLSTYQNLSASYQVFQGLSNFQKEVVAYKNQKDIYSTLIDTLVSIFPFRKAVVVIPPPDFKSPVNDISVSFQIINSSGNNREATDSVILRELEMRWAEFSKTGPKKFVVSENRHWIAIPLRGENNNITAIFVGWIKPRINPLSFTENLSLFISFAAQTTEWLSLFKQNKRVLQHISSIYEAVETVSRQNDPRKMIELFASYTRALTDCDKAIFWMENTGSGEDDEYCPIYTVKGCRDIFPEEEWQETLLLVWSDIHDNKKPVLVDLNSATTKRAQLICVPVKSGEHCIGMLAGIQSTNMFSAQEIIQTMTILADLSAIAVERSRAESFAEKLLVIDEQKRIANEIHDTISQNLFSIVYSIDSMAREVGHTFGEKFQDGLCDIKNLSAETARELRSLIYRLNPRQETNASFVEEVRNFLDKMARMNDIPINYNMTGNTEYLNSSMCKALYRIIKESIGNALRHGKCSEIIVCMDITPFNSVLKVSDNGIGFELTNNQDLYATENHLGLVNMRESAISLQGNINIKSKPGEGTEVTCFIPTSPVSVQ